MAFGAAGRERQDRIQPIECLNRRLLVGREHGRVLRWIHIQPDHVGGFGLEVGIVRLRVRLELWIVPFGKPYLPVCGWPFDSPRPRWRPLEVAPQSSRIHDEYVVIVGVLVSLDVEKYQDGNNDGIGDFEGLMRRLDYLSGLGASCVWLQPFYPSPNRDNGGGSREP
jgi:hypothetical protein